MRLPFISRRTADFAKGLVRIQLQWEQDDHAETREVLAETQRRLTEALAKLAETQTTAAPAAVEHTELWSLIDWSLWGSGMGDTFREQLADQFIAAITPDQHDQALRLIQAWTDSGREPIGRLRYEDQQRRLHRALKACRRYRAEAAVQQRVTRRLTDQLLDATGYQGEPLLDAARHTLDLDKEDA